MSLPAGVTGVTVSSDKPLCLPDGTFYEGTIYFDGPDLVTIAGQDVILGGTVEAELEDGQYSALLAANDDTGMSPTGWTYKVRGVFSNAPGWVRYISLSKNDTDVSLADVLVPDPDAGQFTVLTNGAGFLAKAQNLTDVPDKAAARDNLELGDAAVLDVGTIADTVAAGDDQRFGEIAGVTVSGTPTAGQVPTATSGTEAEWQDPAGGVALDDADTHIQALGTRSAGSTGLAADAGHVHPTTGVSLKKPWIFDITDYGAVGDAVIVSDGAVTGGTATLTCSTSALFTADDVGKSVLIQGAGPSGVTAFTTTIASVASSSEVGLTDTPPTSITGAVVVFGTNSYDAIRTAQAAANAYRAVHGTAQLFTPVGGFILDGPLDTSLSGNGKVVFGPDDTTGQKSIPHFKGAAPGAGVRHWEQTVPQMSGSCWISFGYYTSTSAQTADLNANGNPGIISGPTEANGYGAAGQFSNTMPVIEDMAFLVPHTAFGITHGAWNFYGCANAHIKGDVSISTLGVVPGSDYTSPGVFATGLSVGCLMPAPGNNDLSVIDNLSIQGGFTYGIFFSEHTLIGRLMSLYCWSALVAVGTYAGSVGSVHAMKVLSASVEACVNELYIYGAGSGGVGPIVDIDQLSTESSTPNVAGQAAHMAAARGVIRWTGLFAESGLTHDNPTGITSVNGQTASAVRTVTASTTARPIDRVLKVDATDGAVTVSLPSAAPNPVSYTIIKADDSANAVTIDPAGSETINGAATRDLSTQWEAITVWSDGSNWIAA